MMNSDLIMQLGIGAVFAILILREVLPVVLKAGSKNGNGKIRDWVTHDHLDKKLETVQYKDNCKQIVARMDIQFDLLKEQNTTQVDQSMKAFSRIDDRFDEVKNLIMNGHNR